MENPQGIKWQSPESIAISLDGNCRDIELLRRIFTMARMAGKNEKGFPYLSFFLTDVLIAESRGKEGSVTSAAAIYAKSKRHTSGVLNLLQDNADYVRVFSTPQSERYEAIMRGIIIYIICPLVEGKAWNGNEIRTGWDRLRSKYKVTTKLENIFDPEQNPQEQIALMTANIRSEIENYKTYGQYHVSKPVKDYLGEKLFSRSGNLVMPESNITLASILKELACKDGEYEFLQAALFLCTTNQQADFRKIMMQLSREVTFNAGEVSAVSVLLRSQHHHIESCHEITPTTYPHHDLRKSTLLFVSEDRGARIAFQSSGGIAITPDRFTGFMEKAESALHYTLPQNNIREVIADAFRMRTPIFPDKNPEMTGRLGSIDI